MIQFTTKQLVNHEDVVGRQLASIEITMQGLTGEALEAAETKRAKLAGEYFAIQAELDRRWNFRQGVK